MEYYLLCQEIDDSWNEWMDNKTVGNSTCPLCRDEPNEIEKKSDK
jgi:hypothetical protein